MTFNLVDSFYTAPSDPVEVKQAVNCLSESQKAFTEMTYSRTVEKENNFPLIEKERAFADRLSTRLSKITDGDLLQLVKEIDKFDFQNSQEGSKLLDPQLPNLAMEALRRGLLTTHQAATVMQFWGALQYHQNKNDLQSVELFDGNFNNPVAVELIQETLKFDSTVEPTPPYLEGKKFDTFISLMQKLPLSEQRFLLVPDIQGNPSSKELDQQLEAGKKRPYISQIIKHSTGINVFGRVNYQGRPTRMVPSMGMMQAFLDAQFGEQAVTIKPRTYLSTDMQLRECGMNDTRDMLMPFPNSNGVNRNPKLADYYKAPWYDFPYHDFYHCIIASGVGKFFRRAAIDAADVVMQLADTKLSKENVLINAASHDDLKRLSSSIIDMEHTSFQHYPLTLKWPKDHVFWMSIQVAMTIRPVAKSYKDTLDAFKAIYWNLVAKYPDQFSIESFKGIIKEMEIFRNRKGGNDLDCLCN